jgi:Asp-tRNA(Asn)/Glu-tRNA(Gln) amidotransferase A subunit family amidase
MLLSITSAGARADTCAAADSQYEAFMISFHDYRRHDALGLAGLVARGEVSSAELLQAALARADAVQPFLHALTQRLDDEARRTLHDGPPGGPFAGVPFLLKDVSVQMAGTVTRNGGWLFDDVQAEHDSTVVARYRQAGLVIFGKTNTPEMGLAASTETTRSGSARNPWNIERTAGGSSGGAAAAVASGIVPAAQGSDGGGSIRIPSSCCGLFGLKPTRARVPLGPLVGESWGSLGVVHVLTRSVRDSAALLDATHGPAPGDPYFAPAVDRPFLQELERPPARLRIALQRAPLSGVPVDHACLAAVDDAARLMQGLGHDVEPAQPPGNALELGQALWTLVATGVAAVLQRRAAVLGRELTAHDMEAVTWRALQHAASLSATDHAQALHVVHGHGRHMAAFHERFDILLSPTLAQQPMALGPLAMSNPDADAYRSAHLGFSPFTGLFNISGQPSMSVPLHWSDEGLPVGVMCTAAFGREDLLLRLARQLEQARPWFDRVPPEFVTGP